MAVAAETAVFQEVSTLPPYLYEVAPFIEEVTPELPAVIAVPEMPSDMLTRYRASRFIGTALLNHGEVVETIKYSKPIESLAQGIKLAHEGDEDGRNMVRMNVSTDAVERVYKTGQVGKKVPLSIDQESNIVQFCQRYDSIQVNSLRRNAHDPVMAPRTEAEARNGLRMKALLLDDAFENYSMVVFSPAEKRKGFFTETMSLSIQVTAKEGDGLTTEPAFVSGIAAPGQERHDLQTIATLGERLGVDLSGKTPAEIIDTPVLIRNDLIPNGAIDVVKLYDDVNGTFFGEDKPREDYLEYLEVCRQREENLADKIETITSELIAEAPHIHTPAQAVEMLDKISGKHMVLQAVEDPTIDARVFGPTSAAHISQARIAHQHGDNERVASYTQKAIETEESYSCPTALKANSTESSGGGGDGDPATEEKDQYGSLEFECPYGHRNKRPYGQLIDNCQHCGVSVKC